MPTRKKNINSNRIKNKVKKNRLNKKRKSKKNKKNRYSKKKRGGHRTKGKHKYYVQRRPNNWSQQSEHWNPYPNPNPGNMSPQTFFQYYYSIHPESGTREQGGISPFRNPPALSPGMYPQPLSPGMYPQTLRSRSPNTTRGRPASVSPFSSPSRIPRRRSPSPGPRNPNSPRGRTRYRYSVSPSRTPSMSPGAGPPSLSGQNFQHLYHSPPRRPDSQV